MNDTSEIPFGLHVLAWRKWVGGERDLTTELLKLWRSNTNFRRMVEMHKFVLVRPGESYYCTRLIDRNGDVIYDEPLGPLKGDVGPGNYVRLTQHHSFGYGSLGSLRAGLTKGGLFPRPEQLRTLKRDGVAYMTNGADNCIHWVMRVDRKVCDLLNRCGYMKLDTLHGKARRVSVGDYLCVKDSAEEVIYLQNGYPMGSKILELKVDRIRSKRYGNDRFRSLHSLA